MVIISSLAVMVIAIYLLSIVTDEFFIESLDEIAHRWKLPSNVAGASLMAMGSSMPELSISMFALMRAGDYSEVGAGTIVGSAVFNILVITGVSALARPIRITWRVVVRDIAFYIISVMMLLYAFTDGHITIVEALAFLSLYAIYIFVLFQWKRWAPGLEGGYVDVVEPESEELLEDDAPTNLYERMTDGIVRFFRLFTGDIRRHYVRTFILSVAVIAGVSWLLVENAILFAEAIGVPPLVIALTVLAGGSSVPDMIASVIVAKEGRGDMAIANAIGSNIFDITIGLGLPWMIMLLWRGSNIAVGTGDLWISTAILMGTVFILFAMLIIRRGLGKVEGGILVGLYVAYVVWAWVSGS